MNTKKHLTLCFCIMGLSSCASTNFDNHYSRAPTYAAYQPYVYENVDYYPQSYNIATDYSKANIYEERQVSESTATVPDTYYAGSYHSPQSPKEADKAWAQSQNVNNYTIQIADEPNAAAVAGTLSALPKTDRSAQIKYNANGKTAYRGVYGSYKNYQEAEQAVSKLPSNIKNRAVIKIWSNVQN